MLLEILNVSHKRFFLCVYTRLAELYRIRLTNFVEPKITHAHPLLLLVCRAWRWTKDPPLGTRVFSRFHQLFAECIGTMKTFSKEYVLTAQTFPTTASVFRIWIVMWQLNPTVSVLAAISDVKWRELSGKGWVGRRPDEGGQMLRVRLQQTEIFQNCPGIMLSLIFMGFHHWPWSWSVEMNFNRYVGDCVQAVVHYTCTFSSILVTRKR